MDKYTVIVTRSNNGANVKPISEESIAVCNYSEDANQIANKHAKRIIKYFGKDVDFNRVISDNKGAWHFIPLNSGIVFRVYVR